MTALAALAGALVGVGVVALVMAIRGVDADAPRRRWRLSLQRVDHAVARLCIALLAGTFIGVLTHWPVAALAATVLALVLPLLLGSRRAREGRLARLAAVAAWAE